MEQKKSDPASSEDALVVDWLMGACMERLVQGKIEYGDRWAQRPASDLSDEALEELVDHVNWVMLTVAKIIIQHRKVIRPLV